MRAISKIFRRRILRTGQGDPEAGMATAEYAVGTVAAVAFAAVLFKVAHSQAVQTALSHIITAALNISL